MDQDDETTSPRSPRSVENARRQLRQQLNPPPPTTAIWRSSIWGKIRGLAAPTHPNRELRINRKSSSIKLRKEGSGGPRGGEVDPHRRTSSSRRSSRTRQRALSQPAKPFYSETTFGDDHRTEDKEKGVEDLLAYGAAYQRTQELAYAAPHFELLASSPAALSDAILALREENEHLRAPRSHRNSRTSTGGPPSVGIENALAVAHAQIEKQQKLLESEAENIEEMRRRLEEEEQKTEKAERITRKIARELANLKSIEANQFDDEFLKGEVTALRYEVFNWIKNQGWQALVENESGVEEADVRKYEREVFGKAIWAGFTGQRDGPDGRMFNIYSQWNQDLDSTIWIENAELLYEWRAISARLLCVRKSKAVENSVTEMIQRLVENLYGELIPISFNRKVNESVLGLEDIFRKAVNLDALLQQQKPLYTFSPVLSSKKEWKQYTAEFSKDSMENVQTGDQQSEFSQNHGQAQEVRLILCPALRKSGNSAGKNYSQRLHILRARVELVARNS
ncbi:hypothetical protein G7Y89_g7221 [Cudoniella acicularis]|uniref:Uncharacterized protein n=1 Tax=Cudoniella acicularis TaxID=354080 RepID=A0A8H4W257_9HELO|nr:hypothetical protein G7Y89_g7221 [Cudoniella acicularis]